MFGLLLCALGLTGVFVGPQEVILPLGLPGLPFLGREAYGSRKRNRETLFPPPVPFWFERSSHFRSFNLTTLTADSNVFTIPTIWHSSGVRLPEGYASRD